MNKHGMALAAGLAALLPASALAAADDYSYLRIDWIVEAEAKSDITAENAGVTVSDDGDEDYDGFDLGAALAITPNFFLKADYSEKEPETAGETTTLSGGIGLNGNLGSGDNPLSTYGTLTYESIEFDGGEFEADGLGVTAGLRWMMTSAFELNPHASYYDYGSVDGLPNGVDADMDGWGIGLDAAYSVTKAFDLIASYRTTQLDLEGSVGSTSLDGQIDLQDEFRLGVRMRLGED